MSDEPKKRPRARIIVLAAIALLVLYPLAVWLGSRLRSGGAQPAMVSQVGAGS